MQNKYLIIDTTNKKIKTYDELPISVYILLSLIILAGMIFVFYGVGQDKIMCESQTRVPVDTCLKMMGF